MRTKKRRGIGTVIASAVMIFLMVFTIGQLYIYSIDELDNYNRAASVAYATQSQKLNEHLSIQSVTLDTSGTVSQDILATVVISNTGGATSQVADVWFDNADTSTNLHTVVPQTNVFIGRGLALTLSNLDTGIGYTVVAKIKMSVITVLGNTVSALLLPPGEAGTTSQTLASVSLVINPPNPITTNDISVVLTVTNNNGLGAAFTNLTPDICLVQGTQTFPTLSSINTCKTLLTQCAVLSFPVTCSSISGFSNPTPASVSFLPYGSTATFQWLFLVNAIIADQPITVLASYESLSTGFFISATLPQAVSLSITVRSPGGASGSSGGNFLNAFGSLVNYFNSFQASQSSGVWVVGTALTSGSNTVFRMNITNLSPNVITFNSNSEILVMDSKTGKIYDFYIVQACTNYQPYYASNTSCVPNAYPANGYILAASQTVTMYFTATGVGGTTRQALGTNGESGQSWTATVAFFGSKFNGGGVTQPVGTTSATISINALVIGGMPTTPATFTLVIQTGWNSGTVTVGPPPSCSGSSCSCSGNGTPTLGITVITGLSSFNCGSSFTMTFANVPGSCPSPFTPTTPPTPPSCTPSGTTNPSTIYSNQYNTFAWGVYNSNTLLTNGGSIPYGQASAVFAVRT